MTLNPG